MIGVLSLAVAFPFLAHVVHAASTTTTTTSTATNGTISDPDPGAACTGTGDSQQGDCNTQDSSQTTAADTNPINELPGIEG